MFTDLKADIRAKFCLFAVPNMFFLLACHSLGILFEAAVVHPVFPLFYMHGLSFASVFLNGLHEF